MNRNVDIIVSGHLCLDLIPRMEHVPLSSLSSPGRLFEVGAMDVSTGGAVSNTGLALHRLGINVRLMATVGGDMLGRATVEFLNTRDPALSQLITVQPDLSSSYTIVLAPQKVDRIFLHANGPNAVFGIANVNFSLLAQAKIFHLGYPPPVAPPDRGRGRRAGRTLPPGQTGRRAHLDGLDSARS